MQVQLLRQELVVVVAVPVQEQAWVPVVLLKQKRVEERVVAAVLPEVEEQVSLSELQH